MNCIPVDTDTDEVDGWNSATVTANACSSTVGKNFQVGQLVWDGNHHGPHSYSFDDLSCEEVMPLVNKSAPGLSSVGQNLHKSTPVTAIISVTRWVTNTVFHFSPLNQWSTIWLSVQKYVEHLSGFSAPEMNLQSLAAVSAAISSNLGSVSCLRGATRALAITKETTCSLQRNATAPYASGLASAKTWSWWGLLVGVSLGKYCLGTVKAIASWMSWTMHSHWCSTSSDSGSSHSTLHCHSVWMKILSLIKECLHVGWH